MSTLRKLTAGTLVALMASTSVASAGQVGDGAVFAEDESNTAIKMSHQEMVATQGESPTMAFLTGVLVGMAVANEIEEG